ncbi:MAG: hypothetical protein ACI4TJ_01515 [Candidatus Cryptobacteroides sp.]
MKKSSLIVLSVFLAGLLVQAFAGYFPTEFFAFPVNVAVLAAFLAGLWVLYREKPESAFCKWLSSGRTSIAFIAVFLGCCLILGLTRQDADAAYFPGFRDVCRTWWFLLIAFGLMANLFLVIVTRRKKGFRFILNHAGLLLVLTGCFFGAPDHLVSRTILTDEPVREAVGQDGRTVALGSAMSMDSFDLELGSGGSVSNYRGNLDIDGKKVELRVNHPYRLSAWEDLYLTGYDKDGSSPKYCIVEIVRQPWKYLIWAGVVMMMAGSVLMFVQGAATRKREENRA